MSATERIRAMLDERGVEYTEDLGYREFFWDFGESGRARASAIGTKGLVQMIVTGITPEQAIAATLGSDRVTLLEEKVKLQGDYIIKLTKEHNALFAQSCEAATRHAGQIDAMQRKLEAATLGAGTCRMELPDLRGPAFTDVYVCSECGGEVMVGTVMGESDVPKWCPWCGRKVVGA